MTKQNYQSKKYTKKDLFKIAHKDTKLLLFGVIFASIIGAGIGIGTPIITQRLIDQYIPDKDISLIIWMIVSLVGLLLLRLISTYIFSYFGRVLQLKVEMQLRQQSFKHMQRAKVEYIDSKNEGHFLTRINEDAGNISQIIRYIPDNLLSGLITAISSFTMVFLYNVYLGIILLGIFLSLIGFTFLLRNSFGRAWTKVRKVSEVTNMSLVNSVSGIKESKIFLAEDNEIVKFEASLKTLFKAWKENFRLYARWMVFNTLILTSIGIIIIGFGAWQVVEGNMMIGELVAAVMYGGQIIDPINKFLAVFDILVNSKTSIDRVLQFWNTDEENYIKPEEEFIMNGGEIEFKDVHFSYAVRENIDDNEVDNKKRKQNKIDNSPVNQKHVLNGVSFKINAGEKVAFVGETGSGKSTILKLISKFYEPTDGQILFDKKDIAEVDVHSIRKNIAYLQQDPYMFFDTISNNIKFGIQNNTFSEEEVANKIDNALHVAKASDFVNALPKQVQENIGPRGVSLSGGQKQRLAIARAILKESKIVLFDEATSALDNETEKDIQKQIESLIEGKTAIFVAHRLSTIKNLDRIFVLKNGNIVESGSHDQLMKQKGYYFKLNKVAE